MALELPDSAEQIRLDFPNATTRRFTSSVSSTPQLLVAACKTSFGSGQRLTAKVPYAAEPRTSQRGVLHGTLPHVTSDYVELDCYTLSPVFATNIWTAEYTLERAESTTPLRAVMLTP